MEIKLTYHAIQRGKERLGLKAKTLKEHALKSLTEEGMDALADETLRPYLIKRAKKHDCSGIYLYRNGVFIFKDEYLVTVYPISWIALKGDAA